MEQAIWALGNIAGDCSKCRDALLKQSGMQIVLNVIDTFKNNMASSLFKNVYWLISNMMRGKPKPKFSLVSAALPYLVNALKQMKSNSFTDNETLVDCLWALSYSSDDTGDKTLQQLAELDVIKIIIGYLTHPQISIQVPTLRTIGNLATGADSIVDKILAESQFLPAVSELLTSSKKALRKEVCWLISNIAAGTPNQVK